VTVLDDIGEKIGLDTKFLFANYELVETCILKLGLGGVK
jgi:hypothetical protein